MTVSDSDLARFFYAFHCSIGGLPMTNAKIWNADDTDDADLRGFFAQPSLRVSNYKNQTDQNDGTDFSLQSESFANTVLARRNDEAIQP